MNRSAAPLMILKVLFIFIAWTAQAASQGETDMIKLYLEREPDDPDGKPGWFTYAARIKNVSQETIQIPVTNRGPEEGFRLIDSEGTSLKPFDTWANRGESRAEETAYETLKTGEVYDLDYWSFNPSKSSASDERYAWDLSDFQGKTLSLAYTFDPEKVEAPAASQETERSTKKRDPQLKAVRELLESAAVSVTIPLSSLK